MTLIPQDYFKAGKIAGQVRSLIKEISVGDSFLEICENIENATRRLGGEPAFPCNVCVNQITAHNTAEIEDQNVVKQGDVLKIDFGVHVGGFIADTAKTITFDPSYDTLVNATEEVLKEAISVFRKDIRVGDIGRVVQTGASRRGFRPISNLSGHTLQQYKIHGGISIPNVWVANSPSIKANEVYAIEPFLTSLDGAGVVVEKDVKNIFSIIGRKKTNVKKLDRLVEEIWNHYKTLPFAARWFLNSMDMKEINQMLLELTHRKILRAYPVLIEAKGKFVAQFEDTIIPTESGAITLTN